MFEGIAALDNAIAHYQIKHNWKSTDDAYIFTLCVDNSFNEEVNNALSKMPEAIALEIKNNWIICISKYDPMTMRTPSSVIGIAYTRAKVIWLNPDFSENNFAHEVGHAIASLTYHDLSTEFVNFYDKQLNQYCELYSAHDTNTSSEFYAFLFEQYICHTNELKEKFSEGYDYISQKSIQKNNVFIKHCNITSYIVRKIFNFNFSIFDILTLKYQIADNDLLDLSHYSSINQFSGLSQKEQVILDKIFDVIHDSTNYTIDTYKDNPVIIIEYNDKITLAEYYKITACIDIYLGQECSDVIDVVSSLNNNHSTIYIYIDYLIQLKNELDIYLKQTELALSQMREGTTTQKLLQICKYITNNCEYSTLALTSVNDFWTFHRGDCITYSFVFYQFCSRLGIQCDVIFGVMQDGTKHVWNRVTLSDGSYKYYDLTNYKLGAVNMDRYDTCAIIAINSYIA